MAPVIRSLTMALTCMVLAGCSGKTTTDQCFEEAFIQRKLEPGVVVYNDSQGIRHWWGWRGGVPAPMVQVKAASLTKPIVADEILRLVAQGKLAFDTPLRDVLPEAPLQLDRRVTIRRLLQHSSGLAGSAEGIDPLFFSDPPDCARAASFVMAQPLSWEPGSKVVYNNSGYCLLGRVVEQLEPDKAHEHQWKAQGLGGAGGWQSSLGFLYRRLQNSLPILNLPAEAILADGSYYSAAWRRWPTESHDQAPWSHYGRLPGMIAMALSDGERRLLVAHVRSDPVDVESVSIDLGRQLWQCAIRQ